MAGPGTFSDEPLTPAGRLFLQPETNIVIHCILRGKSPINVDSVKSNVESSIMVQHPRFCSLLVRDKNGFEHWRRIKLDVDKHIVIIKNRLDKSGNFLDSQRISGDEDEEEDEAALNLYVADLSVSSPLSTDKPLWELHILVAHKAALFRVHHSLGDGISLMSMLMAGCRRADDPDALPRLTPEKKTVESKGSKGRNCFWLLGALWGFLKMICFTLIFATEFIFRTLFLCDRRTVLTGGDGVELWPRKLATAKFLLDDMKLVKKAIPNTTINDVLFGVVSSGLSRYLDHRTPNAMHEGLRMTGVAMVNLRAQPGLQDLSKLMQRNSNARWGNKFGVILLPVYHKGGNNPLEHLRRAKKMVDRKKHSLEAYFSYTIGDLVMSLLGPKYACWLNYRLLCNTTFTISNIVGPLEEITIASSPVSSIKVNTSSLPQALTMHMLSYNGRAEMQILVAKDIIPDPEFLAKCFEDALLEMKEAALGILKD
ncbi:hypothetical protein CCACVL1_16981 [Corchorus capsularis]|uniref:Uncharacterized protein n=1 Tax=Corchorus capsularis TaxID=210143 RepID=A0A1R3HV66_COCAP|nr:hypothetical protein CCACVL1_16981 [Corchorus capsularis]